MDSISLGCFHGWLRVSLLILLLLLQDQVSFHTPHIFALTAIKLMIQTFIQWFYENLMFLLENERKAKREKKIHVFVARLGLTANSTGWVDIKALET